jgi:RNA recognition motif-containing protein
MMNIFVAKLDFGVTSEQLRQEFERFGRVLKATVALDRETGKSRGFAFVEMASKEDGVSAINGLDGKVFNGRPCTVKEADPRPDTRNSRDRESKPAHFSPKKEDSTFNKSIDNTVQIAPLDIISVGEPRKKSKDKKSKGEWDSDGLPKKPKGNSFKPKSRFDDFDDEEDDDELNLLKLRRELEKEDLEDDDED